MGRTPRLANNGALMTQYLFLLHVDESSFEKRTRAEQERGLAAYMAYNAALQEAGLFISTGRLTPPASATTVRVIDGKSQVVDGPYTDTKEQVGGYYLIEAKDLDEALQWAARCPT